MLRREERRMLDSLSKRWNMEEEKFLIKRQAPPPLPLTRSESLQRSSGPILRLRRQQDAGDAGSGGQGKIQRPSVLNEYMAFAKNRMERLKASAPVRPFPSLLAEQSAIEFMQTSQWQESRKNPYADVEDAIKRKKSRWRTRRIVNMELKKKFTDLPYIDQDDAHIVTRKARRLRLAMSEFGMLKKAMMIQEGMESAENLAGGKNKNDRMKNMSEMLYNAHAAWKKLQMKVTRAAGTAEEGEEAVKPSARRGHTLTLVNSAYALLIGGSSGRGSKYCNAMMKLNLVDLCWEKVDCFGTKPPARSYHTALLSDQVKVIVFGGTGKQGNLNDCYELNVLEMRWSILFQSGDVRPSPRHGHTMTQTSQEEVAILFGGAGAGFFNDLFLFDCRTGRWSLPPQHGAPPAPRAFHSTCALDRNNRMFIFGGQNGSANFNDMYDFDMETMTWTFVQTTGILPSPRWGHSAVVQGMDTMIVFGGAGDQFFNDVFLYNLFGSSWKFAHGPGEAPAGRWGHSCIMHGESAALYIFGGCSKHAASEDDTFQFNLLMMQVDETARQRTSSRKVLDGLQSPDTEHSSASAQVQLHADWTKMHADNERRWSARSRVP